MIRVVTFNAPKLGVSQCMLVNVPVCVEFSEINYDMWLGLSCVVWRTQREGSRVVSSIRPKNGPRKGPFCQQGPSLDPKQHI